MDFCRLVAGSEKTKKRANLWVDRNSNAPAANLPPSLRFGQYGDWFRGAAVFCWPVGVVYVGVAVLNQVVRRSGANKWIGKLEGKEKDLWVTKTCFLQWNEVKGWKWTSVLVKGLWIGLIIQTMTVVITKFTYLFLAWLKVWVVVEGFEVWEVTLIIAGVGILMFLFPPIPG